MGLKLSSSIYNLQNFRPFDISETEIMNNVIIS